MSNTVSPRPSGAPPALAPVLIVEDDDVHAFMVEAALTKARLANPVVRARSGEEALAYFEGVGDGPGSALPALVLLDLELPGQSGLAVLEALVGLPGAAACPAIMMSASSERVSIAHARELGVRSYLVKPVAFDALADVIHRLGLRWALLAGDGE